MIPSPSMSVSITTLIALALKFGDVSSELATSQKLLGSHPAVIGGGAHGGQQTTGGTTTTTTAAPPSPPLPPASPYLIAPIPPPTPLPDELYNTGDFVAPKLKPTDPNDSVLSQPFYYNGKRIYKKNPCEKYKYRLKSHKNKGRRKGCRKAANRLKKELKNHPSKNCPQIITGTCFQRMRGPHVGRCYVRRSPEVGDWVLINTC